MWTFQEALAANAESHVTCGSTTVPWQNVLRALKEPLDRARSYPDTSIHRLRYFLEVYTLHRTSQKLTLDKLIMASSDRQATDPRDYIYALLGLIKDDLWKGIEPDYSQQVSVIFQKTMVGIFRSHNSLDFIVYKTLAGGDDPLQSSWCISSTEREKLQNIGELYLNRRFSITHDGAANGRPITDIIHNVEKGTVKLSGTLVGRITESSKRYSPLCSLGEWKIPLPGPVRSSSHLFWESVYGLFVYTDHVTSMARAPWEQVSLNHSNDKITAGDVWKLVANGRRMEYLINEVPAATDELYQELRLLQMEASDYRFRMEKSYNMAIIDRRTGTASQKLHGACWKFAEWLTARNLKSDGSTLDALYSIVTLSKGINVFSISDRYMGSCHLDVEVGDVVCIIFGYQVPLVLREDDEGYYRIIGPAYVDEVMGGEFLLNDGSCRVRDFVII